jgi:hypothetical protein
MLYDLYHEIHTTFLEHQSINSKDTTDESSAQGQYIINLPLLTNEKKNAKKNTHDGQEYVLYTTKGILNYIQCRKMV